MTNPLSRSSAPRSTVGLRQWCDDQNRSNIMASISRWYFMTTRDGKEVIDCLQGVDADNVRHLLNGQLPDFDGWSEKRMRGYRSWLRSCAERGLVEQRAQAA